MSIHSIGVRLGACLWLCGTLGSAQAASLPSRNQFPATTQQVSSSISSKPLVFSNATPIKIPGDAMATSGVASPYPSQITVPDQSSDTFITDVRVRLNGLTHTFPSDLALLLVDPAGNMYVPMSLAGGGDDLNGVNITLDDHAQPGLTYTLALATGSYAPRDYRASNTFPAPAPQPTMGNPYESPGAKGAGKTFYDTFAGNYPEGTWSLYVVDLSTQDTGEITGGWTLMISTENSFTFFPTVIINDSGSPPTKASPYPATIPVSGMGHKLKEIHLYFYGFNHTYPGDVDMLLVAPDGRGFVVMSDTGGTAPASPVVFELSDRGATALPSNGIPSFKQFRATNTTNGGADNFPSPAPVGPYGNAAGATVGVDPMSAYFDGVDPNGDWKLYIVDDTIGDAGSITQWALDLTSYPEYDNPTGIVLNNGAAASPYPSFIAVNNLPGVRTGAYVRFNTFSHTVPQNVSALLYNNSAGGRFLLQSGVGGSSPVVGVTYEIDDAAANPLPQGAGFVDTWEYRPAAVSAPQFPAPAPGTGIVLPAPAGSGSFRSAYLGGNPNGTWNLYLTGAPGGAGTIANGWTLGVMNVYDGLFGDGLEDNGPN
jgi:subtilisin-like proprotein convertase family protein